MCLTDDLVDYFDHNMYTLSHSVPLHFLGDIQLVQPSLLNLCSAVKHDTVPWHMNDHYVLLGAVH